MPPSEDEVTFYLRDDSSGANERQILTVPLSVGLDVQLAMWFQPTMPRSSIHPRVLRDLRDRGLVPTNVGTAIRLRDLRIDRQPVPDLDVRIGVTATILDIDGLIGFDFLRSFAALYVDFRTLKVTLTRA